MTASSEGSPHAAYPAPTSRGPYAPHPASTPPVPPTPGTPRSGRYFLYALNPLAKLAAPAPAMLLLIFTRDLKTPLVFLALSYAILLIGLRLTRSTALLLFVAVPVTVAVLSIGFAVWTDADTVADTPVAWQIGAWTMYSGALWVGVATGMRLAAILALALIVGLSSTGTDLVRSSVQHLRIPYRVGYTAHAALRFVPRFGHELEIIRQAHRVRGAHRGRGPVASAARSFGYFVPLLASAIRHAERVALAMDSRAFGAYPDRTERYLVPWRTRDALFLIIGWLASGVILVALFPWRLS